MNNVSEAVYQCKWFYFTYFCDLHITCLLLVEQFATYFSLGNGGVSQNYLVYNVLSETCSWLVKGNNLNILEAGGYQELSFLLYPIV